MHPVMFRIFGFPIHSYGVMLAIGFLSAIYMASRRARLEGIDPDHISNMSLWVLILSMVGARLFHCFVFWEHYSRNLLQILNVREGGLVFYGGFIGGTLGAMIYFRRNKLNYAQMSDIVAPTVALGLFFARLGCLMAGCCHGKACAPDAFYGIVFPPETVGIAGIPLYPTQIAESLLSLVIFLSLYFFLLPRKKYHGQVIAAFLILYGIARSMLEFFRADPRGFLTVFSFSADQGLDTTGGFFTKLLFKGGALAESAMGLYRFQLSESQVVSLVMFAVAAAIMIFLPKRLPAVNIPAPSKDAGAVSKKPPMKRKKK